MDLSNITISSLTSEPEDLTVIHAQSGLPTEHQSRRTPGGFLIRGDRLPNCIPLPGNKKLLRSWIWQYGESVGYIDNNKDVTKQWVCLICYNKTPTPSQSTMMIPTDKTTTKVIDHLEDLHQFDRLSNKLLPDESKKRKRAFFEN